MAGKEKAKLAVGHQPVTQGALVIASGGLTNQRLMGADNAVEVVAGREERFDALVVGRNGVQAKAGVVELPGETATGEKGGRMRQPVLFRGWREEVALSGRQVEWGGQINEFDRVTDVFGSWGGDKIAPVKDEVEGSSPAHPVVKELEKLGEAAGVEGGGVWSAEQGIGEIKKAGHGVR